MAYNFLSHVTSLSNGILCTQTLSMVQETNLKCIHMGNLVFFTNIGGCRIQHLGGVTFDHIRERNRFCGDSLTKCCVITFLKIYLNFPISLPFLIEKVAVK